MGIVKFHIAFSAMGLWILTEEAVCNAMQLCNAALDPEEAWVKSMLVFIFASSLEVVL